MVSTPPVAVIAATADRRGLLALIPQEHDWWELQRLTGWQMGSPRVESLTFDGDVPYRREDYVRGGMTASPDGRYLLARIFVLDTAQWKRSAVVLLVDLPSYTVVWRRTFDDPLVANARWRFLNADTLVAEGGPPPTYKGHPVIAMKISQDILRMNPVSPGEHEAGILSLPNLEAASRCDYTVGRASEPDRPARTLNVTFSLRGCGGVLKAAGVRSFTELPGLTEVQNLFGEPFGQGCEFEDGNKASELTLYNCRKGRHAKPDDFRMDENEESVARFSLAGLRKVLWVPLKPWEDHSGVLASVDGHDYLVLRRKKLRIEIYEIR